MALVVLGAAVRLSCGSLLRRTGSRDPHFTFNHPDGELRHLAPEWMPLSEPVIDAAPSVGGRAFGCVKYQRREGEIPKVPWVTIAWTARAPGDPQAGASTSELEGLATGWGLALLSGSGIDFSLPASSCTKRRKAVRCRGEGRMANGDVQHLVVELSPRAQHLFVSILRAPTEPTDALLDGLQRDLDL